jgi:hypothetical protein
MKNWARVYYTVFIDRPVWTTNLFIFLLELIIMTVFYEPKNWVLVLVVLLNSSLVIVPGAFTVARTMEQSKADVSTTGK